MAFVDAGLWLICRKRGKKKEKSEGEGGRRKEGVGEGRQSQDRCREGAMPWAAIVFRQIRIAILENCGSNEHPGSMEIPEVVSASGPNPWPWNVCCNL
ncbi:hypothetical protein Taro_023273 [Colocasia esculenta]|uniref:Uncharacterized protein n=1 Tax=Colocasia esculenta TaxID=4460 RepID=A0A843VGV9_COLES|nr:hypothetical protein [Colocasia esculenta]